MAYFCNNSICPYDDCDLKWKHQMETDEEGNPPTLVNLQSACMRITQFIADEINSLKYEE